MRIAAFMISALLLASCAHVISEEYSASALSDVSFRSVRKDIDKYKGSLFIWGGFIVKTTRTETGSEIEIVQNPLDKYGHIIDPDKSQGRFIVLHPGELDPLIYARGRLITVAGELIGGRKITIEEKTYTYPLLESRELYLWWDDLYYSYPPYPYDPLWFPRYRGPHMRRPFIRPLPPPD